MGGEAKPRGVSKVWLVLVSGVIFSGVVSLLSHAQYSRSLVLRVNPVVVHDPSVVDLANLATDEVEEAASDENTDDSEELVDSELDNDEIETEVADLSADMENHGRGWHWLRRPESSSVARATAGVEKPWLQDSGEEFLPFHTDKVDSKASKLDLLVYDINVFRLEDHFGLIDDSYSFEELRDILQQVVDIYAQANVYLRINVQDLKTKLKLGKKQSLVYLGYVEGPDLAEQVDAQKPAAQRVYNSTQLRHEYIEWFRQQMRSQFPVPSLELLIRGSKLGLTMPGVTDAKRSIAHTMLDWSLGFPMMLPPWDLVHTSSIFPVFFLHEPGAQSSAGRIVVSSGGCSKGVHPVKTIYPGKTATCEGFEQSLYVKNRDVYHSNLIDELKTDKQVAASIWAREFGNLFSLGPTRTLCQVVKDMQESYLMQPPHAVTRKGAPCTTQVTKDHFLGRVLPKKQIDKLRAIVKTRDVRQSRTVPDGITVGHSTMQIGQSSPSLFERLVKAGRYEFTGLGRSALTKFKSCGLPQSIVVLNRLPSPKSGLVKRIRWLPTRFPAKESGAHVLVVRPVHDIHENEEVEFRVVDRTDGPVYIPPFVQNVHVEIDLPRPLKMPKGAFLALASVGSSLHIDHRVYSSDKVLFGDVVGPLAKSSVNPMEQLMRIQDTPTTYPGIAFAPRVRDAFFSTSSPYLSTMESFLARKPNALVESSWCTELIANYDLVPNLE